MQEEGPSFTPIAWPLLLSQIPRPEDRLNAEEETVPLRRIVLWVLVWVALFVAFGLYFRYARLLTPLLG